MITGSQQRRLSNPRIISWNAGPHGYRNSRVEIRSIFAQGQPLICLQDLQIPPKLIPAIKDELHAQFPHYWIFISTVNRCHKQLFGRTLQLHHGHGTRLLPLPIRHIRNTSSRTTTRVSTQWGAEERWPYPLRLRVVANLSYISLTNLRLLTRQSSKRSGIS